MQRREFLSAMGVALAGSAVSSAFAGRSSAARLTPPAEGLINVAFAVARNTTWIDFVGPQAVFQTWQFDPVAKKHVPRFKMFMVAEKLEPVGSLIPDYTYTTAPPAQVVVVPAQIGSEAFHEWLRQVHTKADVTMSVCNGAFHVAKAGLLNGKKATTHHKSIDDYSRKFPDVQWVRGVRFVEGEKISTAAGLTSGIDLALRVVERYFGREEAVRVAEHIEYPCNSWVVDRV